MDTSRESLWMKITVTISYLAMIAVNALANILGSLSNRVGDPIIVKVRIKFSLWLFLFV